MPTAPLLPAPRVLMVGLALLAACGPKPTTDASAPPARATPASTEASAPAEDPAQTEAAAAARARSAPEPAGLAAGIISDFEGGELGSEFGAGWQLATDAMQGGASSVVLTVENGALRMAGTIDARLLPKAWAGAMFFPGDQAMRPANLGSKPTLVFQALGDSPMTIMVFAEHLGLEPAITQVEIGPEWASYQVDLQALAGELHDVTAIVFSGPPRAGKFVQQLDDVRLR